MTSEMPKETKKSTMPVMLGAVVIVAGVAAGGLFMMSQKDAMPSDAAAVAAQAQTPAAGEAQAKAETEAPKTETAAAEEAPAPQVIGEGESAIEVGNPVVARVNGQDITRSEVLEFITTLPEQVRQMPLQNLFPMARDRVVGDRMIAAKASGANLENDPEVQKTLEQVKSQLVRNVYVDRAIKESIKDEDLTKAYDELKAELGKVEETRARHILVETEEKAREVVGKLDGGAKFEDLAAEYSQDPSNKESGGDLGYFAKTDMVPEFAEAAFALGVGQYTKDPVKTQFGFHVIKAEDRRQRQAPEFEAVKAQLEGVVRQRKLAELVEAWQKESNVEVFDINGKPEAKADAAPAPAKAE
ncbi:MAG: peptidylprolyl isomerase [Micavibrio sp.]